jgi:hypothetical protein
MQPNIDLAKQKSALFKLCSLHVNNMHTGSNALAQTQIGTCLIIIASEELERL